MSPLRIVFMGSPEFAVPSLEALHLQTDHTIVAVASNPDKRRGRRGKPVPTDVKKRALEFELPVIDVEHVGSESFRNALKPLQADLFVVVAFRILPEDILEIPRLGSVNLHASLLPKYRGAAPIHHAVMNGDKETGCSVFFLNESVDTGRIIDKIKTPIGPMETTGDIYNRLKEMGAGLLKSSVHAIASGTVKTTPQDDSKATPAPKLFRENTRIDFTRRAAEVHNFIRGLNPFPIAWCMYGDEKMNIYRSKPAPDTSLKEGVMSVQNDRLLVGCGDGAIDILELQLPGKKRLSGKDFANGYDLATPLS